MGEKMIMDQLAVINHEELMVFLRLLTNDWDDCIDTLETMQVKGQIETHLSGLKEYAELGFAVKWGAERGMFATNKDGLALVLTRYREYQDKENQEGMCLDCGEAMQLVRYHEEGYPIYWCPTCDPDGPY